MCFSDLVSTAGHKGLGTQHLQATQPPLRTLNGELTPFQLKSNYFGEFFQIIFCLCATLQMD